MCNFFFIAYIFSPEDTEQLQGLRKCFVTKLSKTSAVAGLYFLHTLVNCQVEFGIDFSFEM